MTDWIDALVAPSNASEKVSATAGFTNPVTLRPCAAPTDCFMLRDDKWVKINYDVLFSKKISVLIEGPWMIRQSIGEKIVYFCGNDLVWEKLKDKENRFWILDLSSRMYDALLQSGISPGDFWKMSLKNLLAAYRAQSVLGGTFTK